MRTLTMNFEIPDSHHLDIEKIKSQIYEYVRSIVARAVPQKEDTTFVNKQVMDMSIFDCFSGDFGGNRDAHEVAAELHDSRVFTHDTVTLQ